MDSVDVAGTTADQITEYSETLRTVIMRAVKVFAFVAALVLLGDRSTTADHLVLDQGPGAGLILDQYYFCGAG